MSNTETQYHRKQLHSSNKTAQVLPRELKIEKQEACSAANALSPSTTSPLEYSVPIIAETNFDAETRRLNVILANCNLVLVGQSCAQQKEVGDNWLRSIEDDVQSDSGPKGGDCSLDQQTTAIEQVNYQLQPFFKEAHDCKQAESGEMVIVSVDSLLSLIKKQGYLNGSQCERILERTELLQDSGEFEEHDRLAKFYIQRCANGKNTDMELALKMERGVAFSYQKEFETSKHIFYSVIESAKNQQFQVTNQNILMARAYFLLVANSKRRKFAKLSLLFEFLRRSEFLLQNHDSPEDWAELYMNYACVWLIYMNRIPDDERHARARKAAREKVRHYFEQATSFCRKDHRLRVQNKKETYFHLKMAELILDCSSTSARIQEKTIPPSDIKEAKERLKFVEDKLGDSIPKRTRVQLLKTRSDHFYRQGLYQLAKKTAEEGFQVAFSNRFNTELDSLKERITFLDKKIDKAKLVVITELEHSSSETCYSESE